MRKLSAFTIIELIIIVTVVSGLIIATAPSIYGIFKKQFLIYNTHHVIQDLKNIQSNAFVENKYYKFGFNSSENKFIIWKFINSNWVQYENRILHDTEINYIQGLSDSNHIIYGKNGNAFLCTESETPLSCQTTLSESVIVELSNPKKTIILELLPINGYVSSNISVK
ncbi:MAG: type II secretion system protein [Candidatus Margulisiibacteriota bacterium]